jgi:hypothetical protein
LKWSKTLAMSGMPLDMPVNWLLWEK